MARFAVLTYCLLALGVSSASCEHTRTPPAATQGSLPPGPTPGLAPGAPIASGTPQLRITFVDVGQGDAALLETVDGHAALIDAGPPEGAMHLLQVLAEHHVTRLDFLLLSHPHLDHLGGARKVLDMVACDRVIDPAYPQTTSTYERLLATLQTKGIPFVRGQSGGRYTVGNIAAVEILQPHDPFIDHSRSEANANSIVAKVTVGAVRVLFMGDAEHETEARLLRENSQSLRADVLKIAHHGSAYATGEDILQQIQPSFAVLSCGLGNEYGHPAAVTLQRLQQHRIPWYRTDLQGDIVLYTDGAQVSILPSRMSSFDAMLVPGTVRSGRGETN